MGEDIRKPKCEGGSRKVEGGFKGSLKVEGCSLKVERVKTKS
jgi:hypothetical protein